MYEYFRKMFKQFCKKYKLAILLSVIMFTRGTVNRCEEYIMFKIVSIHYSYQPPRAPIDICPARTNDPTFISDFEHRTEEAHTEDTMLYWTENDFIAVMRINDFSPIFSMLYGGLYSDKYGGKNVVVVGLIVSGTVISASYFSVFKSSYVFLAMLFLRWMAAWIVLAGIMSLAGKFAMADERTTFLSLIFVGQSLGYYLAESITSKISYWRTLCYLCSFMSFTTALGSWLLFRSKYVPKTPRFIHIPWKTILSSVSFYTSILLILSYTILWALKDIYIPWYATQVLHFDMEYEWKMVFLSLLAEMVGYIFCGSVSDFVISKQLISTSTLRRTISSVLFIFWFGTLVLLSIAKCDIEMALACLMLLNYFTAISKCTFYSVALDVSPAFSGIVISIATTIAHPVHDVFFQLYFYIVQPRAAFADFHKMYFIMTALAGALTLPLILHEIKNTAWGYGVSQSRKRRSEMKSRGSIVESAAENNPGPSK